MTAFVIEWITDFVHVFKFESILAFYLSAQICILRFKTEG